MKDFDLSNLNFTKEKTGEQIFEIYSASKLCNILFTRELAKRIKNTGNNFGILSLSWFSLLLFGYISGNAKSYRKQQQDQSKDSPDIQ